MLASACSRVCLLRMHHAPGFGELSLIQITLMEVEKVDQKQQESVYTTHVLMYFFAYQMAAHFIHFPLMPQVANNN